MDNILSAVARRIEKNNPQQQAKQLVEFFYSGCKPKSAFKIGLELEKLPVNSYNYRAVPYSGKSGIAEFLEAFSNAEEVEQLKENANLLGLRGSIGTITLEPGCQTELSLVPFKKISDIDSLIKDYNAKTAAIGDEFGIIWVGCGIQPLSTYENIEIIPKTRYDIMSGYLPSKGKNALVMMKESAGLQVSIDYESEEDAMNKLKVALAISPIITAMFANSPIRNGMETGYKSYRALAWLYTDNERCGLISKKIFEGDYSFSDYANYLLNIPMFFIHRENRYINAVHLTFKRFISEGLAGFSAELDDWNLHATTVFPEARLKNVIEIRNCDCQRTGMIMALSALVKGIFYNPSALEQAWALVKDFSYEEIEQMRSEVPKYALETVIKNKKISDLAKELVNIAEASLIFHKETKEEAFYLEDLKELVEQGFCPADVVLKNWHHSWNRSVGKLVEYSRIS